MVRSLAQSQSESVDIELVPRARLEGYVQRDAYWASRAHQLMKIKRSIEDLERVQFKLAEELKKLSEGVNSFGGGFRYTKSMRKGAVDYRIVPELIGVNLEPYRGDKVEVWKLSMELK
jgi:hypothetical protein